MRQQPSFEHRLRRQRIQQPLLCGGARRALPRGPRFLHPSPFLPQHGVPNRRQRIQLRIDRDGVQRKRQPRNWAAHGGPREEQVLQTILVPGPCAGTVVLQPRVAYLHGRPSVLPLKRCLFTTGQVQCSHKIVLRSGVRPLHPTVVQGEEPPSQAEQREPHWGILKQCGTSQRDEADTGTKSAGEPSSGQYSQRPLLVGVARR